MSIISITDTESCCQKTKFPLQRQMCGNDSSKASHSRCSLKLQSVSIADTDVVLEAKCFSNHVGYNSSSISLGCFSLCEKGFHALELRWLPRATKPFRALGARDPQKRKESL